MSNADNAAAASILAGVRVVELAAAWSASALCGTLLAELGADVVTIAADGHSHNDVLAANKRGVRIDSAASDRDREIETLIETADVVLDDRTFTQALRVDVAVDRAVARDARLVHCIVTPFGQSGALSGAAGSELLVQALSGVMSTTGFPGDPPTRVGVPVGENTASFYAGCGILAALYRRLATGRGETIDISIHDCLLAYLATFLPAYCQSGREPGRIGNLHPMVAPWNSYQARDGWVIVCVGSDKQWGALTRLIGDDALLLADAYPTRESRLRHREDVDASVATWVRPRTVGEIVDALDALDIPAGPILTIADLAADPQFEARELLLRDPDDARAIRGLGSLFKMSCMPERGGPARSSRTNAVERRSSPVQGAPLAGVRVLECAAYTAGPLCARILADLGAEVIKVEPDAGDPVRTLGGTLDGMSHIFHVLNYGKKSITVDARSDEGRATLLALCAQSNVLVDNLAPGVLAKWGLDIATLRARNPQLVYCSINGYGWNGPMGAKRAFDTVIQARAAILSQTGYADGPPTKMGASLADVACAVFGALSIAAAIYGQRRSGVGRFLDVSMFDVLARMSARSCIDHLSGDVAAGRQGNASRRHAPHNLYRAKDACVVIAILDDGQWERFRQLLASEGCALPDGLASSSDRLRVAERLDAAIAAWAIGSEADALVARCGYAGVPAAKVLDIDDVVRHPHVRDRGMMPVVQIGDRRLPLLGSPIKLAGDRRPLRIVPAPGLGAHNDEIIGALRALEIGN